MVNKASSCCLSFFYFEATACFEQIGENYAFVTNFRPLASSAASWSELWLNYFVLTNQFQYSIYALVKYYKHLFKLIFRLNIALLLIVGILHTNKKLFN